MVEAATVTLDKEESSESLAVMVDSMLERAAGSSSSSSSPGESGTPEGEWSGADIESSLQQWNSCLGVRGVRKRMYVVYSNLVPCDNLPRFLEISEMCNRYNGGWMVAPEEQWPR